MGIWATWVPVGTALVENAGWSTAFASPAAMAALGLVAGRLADVC
jgi:hypothetical protein